MAEGDARRATFEEYVAARAPALARTAYLLTGDHHAAEDLVQSTLLKAAGAWHRIEGEPDPYVRRILHTQAISSWRRRRARVAEVFAEAPPEQGTHDPDVALRVAVRAALARLTPKQRSVLVLCYVEDLTEAQTAEVLGIGVGTVKSNTRDALARLRAVAPELADLVGSGGP